jgi:NitT/TauT family transport system permease protein
MLSGSYYGQTVQIWAALLAAALIAAIMVAGIGKIDRMLARRMGAAG